MKVIWFIVILLLPVQSFAAINCRADLSFLKENTEKIFASISIIDETKSRVSGVLTIEGKSSERFTDVEVIDYAIRAGLDFSTDPEDGQELNYGETSLYLLQAYLTDSMFVLAANMKASFKLSDVKKVRLYDIGEDAQTRFGGSPLLSYYNAKGKLLGHFFGLMMIANCQ